MRTFKGYTKAPQYEPTEIVKTAARTVTCQ